MTLFDGDKAELMLVAKAAKEELEKATLKSDWQWLKVRRQARRMVKRYQRVAKLPKHDARYVRVLYQNSREQVPFEKRRRLAIALLKRAERRALDYHRAAQPFRAFPNLD